MVTVMVLALAGDARAQDVTFDGGVDLPGTLYLVAGDDIFNAELYRARGPLAAAERITRKGRVSAITGHGRRLAVSNARGSGSDRLELARLGRRWVLPGRLVDAAGQAPRYSPRGRLLWHVQRYKGNGALNGVKVIVAGERGRNRRVALRLRKGDDALVGWGRDDRLALVRRGRNRIILDPGTPHRSQEFVLLDRISAFETSTRGEIWAAHKDRVAILHPSGEQEVYEIGDWFPLTWSPDGRSILVSSRDDRLGLLSPKDGSVREIGGASADIAQAVWLR